MDEILGNLRKGVNFVATMDGDRPKCRPFGAAIEFGDSIYLFTSNQKNVYHQIIENPNIEIVSMIGDMKWQRLSAKAVADPRPEVVEAFLADDPELQKDYSANDGRSMPLRLADIKAFVYTEGEGAVELT